jgi:hypothetical protein
VIKQKLNHILFANAKISDAAALLFKIPEKSVFYNIEKFVDFSTG